MKMYSVESTDAGDIKSQARKSSVGRFKEQKLFKKLKKKTNPNLHEKKISFQIKKRTPKFNRLKE